MEIEKVKEQLLDLIRDRRSFLNGDDEHDDVFRKDIEVIETTLNQLEKSKKEKEEFINRLKDAITFPRECHIPKDDPCWIKSEFAVELLKLLKGEINVINKNR